MRFCVQMLSYRSHNLRDYAELYSTGPDAFGIDGVFGSMVDFDNFYSPLPLSNRQDQMKLHALLSRLSGGYMLPLVPYNPWTDINTSDSSLSLVETAIRDWGHIGVKIYPPIGYFPAGNGTIKTVSGAREPPDRKLLDAKLKALYELCAKYDVPVMAHSEETMGFDYAGDDFGGPPGWGLVLGQGSPAAQSLRIDLAHFGGEIGGKDASGNPRPTVWPSEFAQLMASNPAQNGHVYGDLGYWSSLRDCVGSSTGCAALARLKAALQIYPQLKARVMFGSDWYMIVKEPDWYEYPDTVAQATAGVLDDRAAFFYKNAIDCYGLAKGAATRQRLDQLFPGGLPEWIRMA